MMNLTGNELDAAVARALGHSDGINYSMPSFSAQLQKDHLIATYPYRTQAGTDCWIAGFNIRTQNDHDRQHSWIALDHPATADTPEVAICRCIVVRGEAIRAQAWDRAERARRLRQPWTEFANDMERAAYVKALNQQHDIVQQQNPDLYPRSES